MPSKSAPPKPQFFASAEEWRAWLERHHATETALWVGLVKVGSGLSGLTHKAALDEALCYGWIDGQTRTIDQSRWMIRFSRRNANSNWSQINLKRVEHLRKLGRMRPAGLAAHDGRKPGRENLYSFENPPAELGPALGRRFRANKAAWAFFATMPPSYRKTATFWVMSAKKPETRERRLAALIEDSAAGRKIGPLRRPGET
jgi:uncharacterized protein YdeI (YjbR/CyaY-like superfamily)